MPKIRHLALRWGTNANRVRQPQAKNRARDVPPVRKLNPEPSLTQQTAFLDKRGVCVEGRLAQSRGNQSVTEPDHQQGEHHPKESAVSLKGRAPVDVTAMRTIVRVRGIRADLSLARFARHEFRHCAVVRPGYGTDFIFAICSAVQQTLRSRLVIWSRFLLNTGQ